MAPEVNPPGDIPDTQAFVRFTSAAGGYSFEVPEGWARSENGADVTFVDKLDGVRVTVTPASAAPTAATAQQNEQSRLPSTRLALRAHFAGDATARSFRRPECARWTVPLLVTAGFRCASAPWPPLNG